MRPRRLLLLSLLLTASGCATSYELSLRPEPEPLRARPAALRPALTMRVTSTYAPFVAGALDLDDRYPRDGRLGAEDAERYRAAFAATAQFGDVTLAEAGDGLHCELAVVSGREPPDELLRVASILFTLGLLPHRQREVVLLEATLRAPGRAPTVYALEARVTTDAVGADETRLRRAFAGPEQDLARALVARVARDGWLDPTGAAR